MEDTLVQNEVPDTSGTYIVRFAGEGATNHVRIDGMRDEEHAVDTLYAFWDSFAEKIGRPDATELLLGRLTTISQPQIDAEVLLDDFVGDVYGTNQTGEDSIANTLYANLSTTDTDSLAKKLQKTFEKWCAKNGQPFTRTKVVPEFKTYSRITEELLHETTTKTEIT